MKNGIFPVKLLNSSLSHGRLEAFPFGIVSNYWVPSRVDDASFASTQKEDMVDHIVLHCSKVVILWMLVNALLGVWGMMHSSVRDTLLNWHESFVKKKTKKAGKVAPLYLF